MRYKIQLPTDELDLSKLTQTKKRGPGCLIIGVGLS